MSMQKDSRPNHRYRTLTATQVRERLFPLLERGLTITEIADELGRAKSTISWHARQLGVPAAEKFGNRYDWSEIQQYYDAGNSIRACCERFGFSTASWHEAVKRGKLVS